MSGRSVAIGDIHGCLRTFVQLLQKIDLQKTDSLYLLGDYVDRGPDTRGLIDYILEMREDGYDVRPIRGNHEEMLLLALHSPRNDHLMIWLELGGSATLRSYRVHHPREIPRPHLEFLSTLPLYLLTDDFVFVHAGLDCTLDDPFSTDGESAMLWDRTATVDQEKLGGRTVIAGHTPLSLREIMVTLKGPLIRLDNGCVFGNGYREMGNLVALDLDTRELFLQKNIDRVG